MKKYKCGMYGEMPAIDIKGYAISEMSSRPDSESIWIVAPNGEGAEFHKDLFLPFLIKFYNDHF